MAIAPSTAFTLGDLAAFDEAHLREIIANAPGAVPPALAGRAFGVCDPPDHSDDSDYSELSGLAERIEHTLAPDDRAAFARNRQQTSRCDERDTARHSVLEQLFWELVYWKMPADYEQLTSGEQVHLGALDVARVDDAVMLDAGAGTGRITLPMARRARKVYAMDAAPPLLHLLERKCAGADLRNVELIRGLFRRVPLHDDSVDGVIACSAFGTQEARGGERGLDELQRVTRPGGRIVIVWPEDPAWFVRHGFHYTQLAGSLMITFPTLEIAYAVAARFYCHAAIHYLDATHRPEMPFHVLGVKEPRDLCWLTVRK